MRPSALPIKAEHRNLCCLLSHPRRCGSSTLPKSGEFLAGTSDIGRESLPYFTTCSINISAGGEERSEERQSKAFAASSTSTPTPTLTSTTSRRLRTFISPRNGGIYRVFVRGSHAFLPSCLLASFRFRLRASLGYLGPWWCSFFQRFTPLIHERAPRGSPLTFFP